MDRQHQEINIVHHFFMFFVILMLLLDHRYLLPARSAPLHPQFLTNLGQKARPESGDERSLSYFVWNFVARPVARGLPFTHGPSCTALESSTARAMGVIVPSYQLELVIE